MPSSSTEKLRQAQKYSPKPNLNDPILEKNLVESSQQKPRNSKLSNSDVKPGSNDAENSQLTLYSPEYSTKKNKSGKKNSLNSKEDNSQLNLYAPQAGKSDSNMGGDDKEKSFGGKRGQKQELKPESGHPKRNLGGAEIDPNLLLEGEGTRSRL